MDTWLITYTTISLGCNFSILDALFHNFPAKTALGIWKQLERRQVNCSTTDYRHLESNLMEVLTDNNWKQGPHFNQYRPLRQIGNVCIIIDGPYEFREEYGQIAIMINRLFSPRKWIIALRGDDGIYRVEIASGQFENSFATEMRIFSEEFRTYLQLVQPKSQVEVEHFITLLRADITTRRPLLQATPAQGVWKMFLKEALASYSREFIKTKQ